MFQLYVNNAAYVYNEETGEIEMLSQVDSVDDLQVGKIWFFLRTL